MHSLIWQLRCIPGPNPIDSITAPLIRVSLVLLRRNSGNRPPPPQPIFATIAAFTLHRIDSTPQNSLPSTPFIPPVNPPQPHRTLDLAPPLNPRHLWPEFVRHHGITGLVRKRNQLQRDRIAARSTRLNSSRHAFQSPHLRNIPELPLMRQVFNPRQAASPSPPPHCTPGDPCRCTTTLARHASAIRVVRRQPFLRRPCVMTCHGKNSSRQSPSPL